MPVEGMVRLMDLADDSYAYDPDRQRLLGCNTGRHFRLGQIIRVLLADVHKGRLEIRLIPERQAGFSPASRRRRSGGMRSL
jgi:ribonuclease R